MADPKPNPKYGARHMQGHLVFKKKKKPVPN